MRAALLFAIIFIATLRSWYLLGAFSADNFVLVVLAAFLLLYANVLRSIPRASLWIAAGVVVALCGGLLVTLLERTDDVKIMTPLSIAASAFCGLLISAFPRRADWLEDIETALKYTILLHAAFLFAQLAAVLLFGVQLDFQVHVTGEESRNIGGSLDNLGLGFFYRPSGLLAEPGTYAGWLLPLITLYLAMRSYRSNWTVMLALLSVFATFSSQGVVGATIVTAVVLYANRGWFTVIALPLFATIATATISLAVWQRFVAGDGIRDASAENRISSFQGAFGQWFGNGFQFPDIDIADSSTLVYWWWYVGLSALPLLAIFGLIAVRYWRDLALLFIVLFVSKVPASAPLYWLILGLGTGFVAAKREIAAGGARDADDNQSLHQPPVGTGAQ